MAGKKRTQEEIIAALEQKIAGMKRRQAAKSDPTIRAANQIIRKIRKAVLAAGEESSNAVVAALSDAGIRIERALKAAQ